MEQKMKANQALFALVIAAAAPFAAYAESPDAIKFVDAPSTLSVAQVRADYIASAHSGQRFGEAYPVADVQSQSVKTRQEVRADYLASDRRGQRFGEAYPANGNATTIVAGMQAEVQ
jgi:predicted outer membrane protein